MARKKAAKQETKSEFLRKALRGNPELDYNQIIRKWTRTGHAGVISNPLYYKIRGELGIRTEWAWVKDSSSKVDESLLTKPVETNRSNDDLVEAVEKVLPKILMLYKLFEDKRPIMEFDLQTQQILAYPHREYQATLSERSQALLAAQYDEAVVHNKVVVFVRDNQTRRLTSMLFKNE